MWWSLKKRRDQRTRPEPKERKNSSSKATDSPAKLSSSPSNIGSLKEFFGSYQLPTARHAATQHEVDEDHHHSSSSTTETSFPKTRMLKTVPPNLRVFAHFSGPLRCKNRNGKRRWTVISAESRRRGGGRCKPALPSRVAHTIDNIEPACGAYPEKIDLPPSVYFTLETPQLYQGKAHAFTDHGYTRIWPRLLNVWR